MVWEQPLISMITRLKLPSIAEMADAKVGTDTSTYAITFKQTSYQKALTNQVGAFFVE
jgi:hypothetical protein